MGSFQSCWIRRLVTLKNPNAFHLAASLNMLAISLLTVASRWLWFQESHAYMVTSVKKRSFSSHTFVFMREENLYQKHSPQPPRSLPLRSYWPKLITERGTTVICLSQSRFPHLWLESKTASLSIWECGPLQQERMGNDCWMDNSWYFLPMHTSRLTSSSSASGTPPKKAPQLLWTKRADCLDVFFVIDNSVLQHLLDVFGTKTSQFSQNGRRVNEWIVTWLSGLEGDVTRGSQQAKAFIQEREKGFRLNQG